MINFSLKSAVIFTFTLVFLTACGPRSLSAGGNQVRVYNSVPTSSCKFVGNISNPGVHDNLNLTASEDEMKKDDINYLKNEGARLGANVVVLVTHTSYQTQIKRYGKLAAHSKSPYMTVTSHKVTAKAYKCDNAQNINSGVNIYHSP